MKRLEVDAEITLPDHKFNRHQGIYANFRFSPEGTLISTDEWNKHADISRFLGMTEDEIESSKTGPDTPGLSELDRLLLQATDELHGDAHIADATWQGLSEHLNTQQLMDLVFTVGQYNLVSMALNSFGVQPDG